MLARAQRRANHGHAAYSWLTILAELRGIWPPGSRKILTQNAHPHKRQAATATEGGEGGEGIKKKKAANTPFPEKPRQIKSHKTYLINIPNNMMVTFIQGV